MKRDEAQRCLNLHPDASPFWDSPDGQEALEAAREFQLAAQNTNRERCRIHGELMRQAEDSVRGERRTEKHRRIDFEDYAPADYKRSGTDRRKGA